MRRKMGLSVVQNKLDDEYVKGVQQAGSEAVDAVREGLKMHHLSKKIKKKQRREEKRKGGNKFGHVKDLLLISDDNESSGNQ